MTPRVAISILLVSVGVATGQPARHLFLDPAFVQQATNVSLHVNPPQRREAVITHDKPWEQLMITLFLTVRDENGKLRMWYICRDKANHPNVAYAESTDGVLWVKPNLGIVEYDGSKDNNLVGLTSLEGVVFQDPNAPAQQRYAYVTHLSSGMVRFYSPDGLHWKHDKTPLIRLGADTQNVTFWDERLGKYVLYLRGWETRADGKRYRKVVRAEMPSLTTPLPVGPSAKSVYMWGKNMCPVIGDEFPTVFATDKDDPPNTDVYNISAQPYPLDPHWYVGFPSILQREKRISDGPLHVQFTGSRDGIAWHRYDRAAYVPLNPDENMEFMGTGLVVRGDEIWQYGLAFHSKHGDVEARKKKTDGVIYRYVQRVDGFVSLDFGADEGKCVTAPVKVDGSRLLLNVDAQGELRVSLLDAPGFTATVRTNSTNAALPWDLTALKGREVRLALSGTCAKLYSFRFESVPQVIALRELPLLFADDSGIAKGTGVVRTVHVAKTRSAPVIEAVHPWEGSRVYVYGSVYADDTTGVLRLWYMSSPLLERSAGRIVVPGLRSGKGDLVLYATSKDGVRWIKPSLGIYACDGSFDNNIVFDLHSPSVLLDARETDPTKRYKMLGAMRAAYHAAFSADGLHWTNYPKDPVLKYTDTITLTQDPVTGEYLAFHKRPAKVRGFGRRVVWLARSRDFQTWTEPELVFVPDEKDDVWATDPEQRTEVYNMSVYPHAAGFIGLPTMFRLTKRIPKSEVKPGQSPDDGPIDVQLATSADGRMWQRSEPRVNVIPCGAPGSFDAGAILGVSTTCVHVGDKTWVYYTGLTTTHGGAMPAKRLAIGRAEWRRHGFVSIDAGRVETKPLQLGAPTLIVNADASRGELRVTLLEADGRPIPGGNVLRADDTHWRAFTNAPTDRPVRVVLEPNNARLYSVSSGTP
jgi:hypothetical protein